MRKYSILPSLLALAVGGYACSAGPSGTDRSDGTGTLDPGNGNSGSGSGEGDGTSISVDGGDSTGVLGDGSEAPKNCDEAAAFESYVGCEFWPTITANPVWTEFDPAVVVANGSADPANITITGPAGFNETRTVPPGGLETILLKWVPGLKGPEFDVPNTTNGRLTESGRVDGGAYKVTSDMPVSAWQFNPLQYRKEMSECPRITFGPDDTECRSATNDASLLLPTTAMTNNYRVFAYSSVFDGALWGTVPGGMAITATKDSTSVQVQLAPHCGVVTSASPELGDCVAAGPGVTVGKADDIYTFEMNAGDVVQLVGAWGTTWDHYNADISGSVINANQPVQVIAFNAIANLPNSTVANADHMEETVLPAEVIGNEYIVVPPTTPNGDAVGHVVRIYGNVDGTKLEYPEGAPPGAPTTIDAGEMVQVPAIPVGAISCTSTPEKCVTTMPFVVKADQPFAVASFMVGGTLQMPGTTPETSQGDPAMTMLVTPKQFRRQYTFLAPADYVTNFAEVLIPNEAEVLLDGIVLSVERTAIGSSGWSFIRAPLSGDSGGVHQISTTDERGLGLQVAGFGYATSYYYPGGLNLKKISEPPVIVVK